MKSKESIGRIEIGIVVTPVQRRRAFQCHFCSSTRFVFDPDFDSDFDLDRIGLSFMENRIKKDDDYVDWTCADGYNWGDAGGAGRQSFEEIFADIYPQLAQKNKPIMIGEMASAEIGGNKAEFIDGIIPKSRHGTAWLIVLFDIFYS